MRLNRFLALTTDYSRRNADELITSGRVNVNGSHPTTGYNVAENDIVTLDGKKLQLESVIYKVVLFNKPYNYVCSRDGQGSKTIYDVLPQEFHNLNPVGRLDKDSSGLLVLTNDGELANKLTHPIFQKQKVYEIRLNVPLKPEDRLLITGRGVILEDGPSSFTLKQQRSDSMTEWQVTMSEGRNRQIRRTFSALNYTVKRLHRIQFGNFSLGNLADGKYRELGDLASIK